MLWERAKQPDVGDQNMWMMFLNREVGTEGMQKDTLHSSNGTYTGGGSLKASVQKISEALKPT